MDFSLTDTQLPMFIRIFNLVLALQNGDLDKQAAANAAKEQRQGKIILFNARSQVTLR